jgi:diguanylate cyclase (GGDEF)-like protein
MEIPCPDGRAAKITVSIGVKTQAYGADGTVDSFISGADDALYKAKETGRNKICPAGS